MLKAYMDESGIHDGSPVLCVGAYLGRPAQWRDWTKAWNLAKRQACKALGKPVFKVYHATDAANCEGEFEDWTDPEASISRAVSMNRLDCSGSSGLGLGFPSISILLDVAQ